MEPSDMSLLATLDALLQEGSVTNAAKRLGLSTPAMSHALARIRERLGDPLLVRSGRGMVLTPRAIALRDRVHAVVEEARATLEPEGVFVASELRRTFVVHASDYVLSMLGARVDSLLRLEAPNAALRFIPNVIDDAVSVRDGGADMAVGIYGELPQEMRNRPLLTERFVCVVRADHPEVGDSLSLEQFVRLPHVQVAPRGKPGGYLDDVLRERGLSRTVARAVPFFFTALQLTAQTDYLLTIGERIAVQYAPSLGLRILEVPLPLRPYALSLLWHPRFDADAGHRFLRELFMRAARENAGAQHPNARKRLDPTDPTSGQARKRPRRAKQ